MFEDNSDYVKLYESLEKIDIKDVKPGSVCFIEHAGLGAMGSPGSFNMLTEDCKLSENNYLKDKSVIDDIYRVIPDYEKMRGEFVSSATKNDTWQILNMGMGNCLFVNKKIADDFYKALKLFMDFEIDGNAYDPGTLYKDWLSGAVYTLKKLNSEGEK